MAIYLTGDIHGMTDDPDRFEAWSFPEGEELTEYDYLIILGDFAMPFAGYPDDELRKLAAKPWTTLFIDGNHEYYPYLRELDEEDWHGGRVQRYPDHPNIIHLMRGEVYEIEGRTFFCLGGATSIDRKAREAQGMWFADELPEDWELDHAEENLERVNWEVDYVLTHTCADRMLERALDRTAAAGYDIIHDDLTAFLDKLEKKLDYRYWFFGHFHEDAQIDERHSILFQDIVDLDDYDF